MIRYLNVNEVLELHNRVMQASGGSFGLLDLGALESAVAQPRMVFADKQQTIILGVAASKLKREAFLEWIREHIVPLP